MKRTWLLGVGTLCLIAACQPAADKRWVTLHYADPTYMAVVPVSRELALPPGETSSDSLKAVAQPLMTAPNGLAPAFPPKTRITPGAVTGGIAHVTVQLPEGQTGTRNELLAQGALVKTFASLPGISQVQVNFTPSSHLEAEPLDPDNWANAWFQAEEPIDTPVTVWWKVRSTSYLVPLVISGQDPLTSWAKGPQGARQHGFEGLLKPGQTVRRDKQGVIASPPLDPQAKTALVLTLSSSKQPVILINGQSVTPPEHVNPEGTP